MHHTTQSPTAAPTATGTADRYFLPELPRLLPVAYHPQAAQTEFRSNAWVRRHLGACFDGEAHLLRLLRERVGLYGPLTAPLADDQRVLDLADFYHFVGLIDDLAVDHSALGANSSGAREVFGRVLSGFGADTDPALPLGRAAADLWRRVSPGLSPRQTDRFRAALAVFLDGIAAELPFQLGGGVPDYRTYTELRLDSFGCDFILLLNEYAMAVDMSGLRETAAFAELHGHGMRQMILVNDLLSLRKEQGDPMNAVRVLEHHDRIPLQQAVDRLCGLVERHERGYVAARDALLRTAPGRRADVRAYLTGLDHLLGGAQEFEYLTPRYFGDGSVWDGTTSGWVDLSGGPARLVP
ncbi:terpene synthase family protein [Streptomyces sp. 549]|uniref:terpene synthase family protein n=1 Tax=Streptomyces sp. 549 TaxID=3049076 RepID=UPI0024C2E8E7|nr:terpene synthase family protein [Streptomyces sp. 549]MDK1474640.1 terpene synthase family protein [Streptomyces sp. 549]